MRGEAERQQKNYALDCIQRLRRTLAASTDSIAESTINNLIDTIAGFVPRPTRLDFDQSSDGHPSVLEDLHDKRASYVPTPPERGERRYKNNNHQDHHVTKVPVSCRDSRAAPSDWETFFISHCLIYFYCCSRNSSRGTLARSPASLTRREVCSTRLRPTRGPPRRSPRRGSSPTPRQML